MFDLDFSLVQALSPCMAYGAGQVFAHVTLALDTHIRSLAPAW